MNKTKIDWCDYSWNPITGCLHECDYCYARKIAKRFDGKADKRPYLQLKDQPEIFDLCEPLLDFRGHKMPYPFAFSPTLHRYRLDEPQGIREPQTIFVCSMADLFGEWVPEEWIIEVFKACSAAYHHRYLFLTKNPERYVQLGKERKLMAGDGFWYGTTVTKTDEEYLYVDERAGIKTFVSIEPIMEPFAPPLPMNAMPNWVIVGAETGNRKGKVKPEKSWLDGLIERCEETQTPIFMKESLRELMGEDFRQEYPWEITAN